MKKKMVAIYTNRNDCANKNYARLVHPEEITRNMSMGLEETIKYLNAFHEYQAFAIIEIDETLPNE